MKQSFDENYDGVQIIAPPFSGAGKRVPSHDPMSRHDFEDGELSSGPTHSSAPIAYQLLHSVRRNWKLGLVMGLFMAGPLALVPWTRLQSEYKATALLRMSAQHVPLMFETADKPERLDFGSFKNTQRQLILTPVVLYGVLKREGIRELPEIRDEANPVEWLQKGLKIEFPDESEIMKISLSLTDGNSAKKVVDAVVATYYEDVVMAEHDERAKRVANLQRVHADAEGKARQKRAELWKIVDQLKGSDSSTLELAQEAAMQQYSLIRSELTKVQLDILRAEAELEHRQLAGTKGFVSPGEQYPGTSLEPSRSVADENAKPTAGQYSSAGDDGSRRSNSANDDVVVNFKLSKMIADDVDASQIIRDVERIEMMIDQTEKRLAPNAAAPYVKRYQEKLEEARRKLGQRRDHLRQQIVLLGDENSPSSAVVRDWPREVQILKEQERRLLMELKRHEMETNKLGRASIETDMLKTEVAALDKLVAGVADELERTKIELKSSSRVTLLGSSELQHVSNSKKRLAMTGAAAVFGLICPLLLLAALDFSRGYVNGGKSVSGLMPVLGTLPLVPKEILAGRIGRTDAPVSAWRRKLEWSVANVTSLLLHRMNFGDHRVMMITSAVPGEGKTTLAELLAKSMANAGHRTLLVDFDLRRPTLQLRLGLPVDPGVSNVMRNGTSLEQTVHHDADCPYLSILTAGVAEGTILQDSENGSLQKLIGDARAEYEIVIVDSSPLLTAPDVRVIGQYTDGAIFSVFKDVSRLPNLMEAHHIMSDYDIPVLGCIVSGDNEISHHGEDHI